MYTNEADVKVISRGTMIEDLMLKNDKESGSQTFFGSWIRSHGKT